MTQPTYTPSSSFDAAWQAAIARRGVLPESLGEMRKLADVDEAAAIRCLDSLRAPGVIDRGILEGDQVVTLAEDFGGLGVAGPTVADRLAELDGELAALTSRRVKPDREPDDFGYLPLAPGVDPDDQIHSQLAFDKAWRIVKEDRELGGVDYWSNWVDGEDRGKEKFRADWILWTDQRRDLVATLQYDAWEREQSILRAEEARRLEGERTETLKKTRVAQIRIDMAADLAAYAELVADTTAEMRAETNEFVKATIPTLDEFMRRREIARHEGGRS